MTDELEIVCDPVAVPAAIAGPAAGRRWARVTAGESGGDVWRLRGTPELFLKRGTGAVAADVADEAARLAWLAGRAAAPAVVGFARDDAAAWLLTEAAPGRTAYRLLEAGADRDTVVDALAAHLRGLHAMPAAECPFDAGHERRLASARARIDAGLVDEDDFDDARDGWSAQDVWNALVALPPPAGPRVVTHGDYSLDNLLIADGAVTGCIDVGRLGLADAYQDLAILWNCLGEFDAALQERLLAAYGAGAVDRGRLEFHLLLDELF